MKRTVFLFCCKGETEFHFLPICPKYIELRKLFIINYTSFPTLTVDNN